MAARKISIKFTDVDGKETTRTVDKGTTLADLLSDGQTGAIDGEQMSESTTLRKGDHVEIVRKSGKAGG